MKPYGVFDRYNVVLSAFILLTLVYQKQYAAAPCPCEIYAAGGTPCVAAHSTVRALYSTYNGNLYQVRRQSDNKTLDIKVLGTGGFANTAAVDSFCSGTKCDLMVVYDQTGKGNDLWYQGSAQVPASNVSKPANALGEEKGAGLMVGGHKAYSVFIEPNNCYWHDGSKSGMATGTQPEGMYMVTSGTHYNGCCCFDYGNSEVNRTPDGAGTMDAINFSSQCWYGTATIPGPWVQADLEWGLFSGGSQSWNSNQKTMSYKYVTAMLKNNGTTNFALKGGNAQSGALLTLWNGGLPSGWSPMKKQGAIILGCGGDCCKPGGGANCSAGTFYEGAVVSGYPTDATDNAIQDNIVAAGYGSKTPVGISNRAGNAPGLSTVKVRYTLSNPGAVINYTLQHAQHVSVNILDQRGRRIVTVADGLYSAGSHEVVWDARGGRAGVYVCRVAMSGMTKWTGKIIVGK
jgi:non-reducing end alpha-L-arabinofuranosidase